MYRTKSVFFYCNIPVILHHFFMGGEIMEKGENKVSKIMKLVHET